MRRTRASKGLRAAKNDAADADRKARPCQLKCSRAAACLSYQRLTEIWKDDGVTVVESSLTASAKFHRQYKIALSQVPRAA
jgi:hypothetical protein